MNEHMDPVLGLTKVEAQVFMNPQMPENWLFIL